MKRAKSLLLVAALMCMGGCVAAAFVIGAGAGVAGYKWYEGSLQVVYEAPLMETFDASLAALEKMKMKITNKEHRLSKAWIFAKRNDGLEVQLSLKYLSAKQTEVDIRVGTFGDQEASSLIGEEIRKELFKK